MESKHIQQVDFSNPNADKIISSSTVKSVKKKQTAVEWLIEQLECFGNKHELQMSWATVNDLVEQAKAMEKQNIIDFVDWLTRGDSLYGILYGCKPERFCTENEDLTIEQVYEEYLKSK